MTTPALTAITSITKNASGLYVATYGDSTTLQIPPSLAYLFDANGVGIVTGAHGGLVIEGVASGVAVPISGTVTSTPSGTQAVSGTFWQATQPVSNASLPLPTNAAQETGGNLATLAAGAAARNSALPANAMLQGISDGTNIQALAPTAAFTLLASAAGSAARTSAQQTNLSARGVILYFQVTANPGAGTGIALTIYSYDPILGTLASTGTAFAAVTTNGYRCYIVYNPTPSIATGPFTTGVGWNLPRLWAVNVSGDNVNSYTYSVTACYLP